MDHGRSLVICPIWKNDGRPASNSIQRWRFKPTRQVCVWALFPRDLYHSSAMLLSVPSEILENIAFEADNRTLQQLRRTCKFLSDFATPLAFQSISIDLSWTRRQNSASLFLGSLTSGPKIGQYITHLSLHLPKKFRSNPSRFANAASIKKKEDKLDSLDSLFLEAIPYMISLRTLSWDSSGDSGPSYATLMFERLGNLPFLSDLEISNFGEWDIPCSPFHHIRNLTYYGLSSAHFTSLLSNNPNLESLDIYVWPSNPEEEQSISAPLSLLSPGALKTFRSKGPAYPELYTHEIPSIWHYFHHLEHVDTDTTLPDEFWDTLREREVHLASLSYLRDDIPRALLSYLLSYTGLRELSLHILASSTTDDLHIQRLLPSIIASHSWCLTTFRIEPLYSGEWCLDHPMLDALNLCSGLESLHVCANKARTQVKANNVIDRTLESLTKSWPNLLDLQINAVSQSFGFDAVRATASQIHKRILTFHFVNPPQVKSGLYLTSDFATYSIKLHDQKNNICAFKVQYLNYYGRKESWRKYKFWERINDD
ncbi:hypothetical protein EDD18DRAFT_770005 [Armillaria luteobubalina]|uniref:F-box domain-containing protein n=1 Tax=Armillaria luteobubalina TaxID=153913 RepID=A0AA39TDM8_9AGAR|nr:hypothetical protein EDD18DRAFT_770005 [Armillaria luteobubalina]